MNRRVLYAAAMTVVILALGAPAFTGPPWREAPGRAFLLAAQPEFGTEVMSNYRGSTAHHGVDRLSRVPLRLKPAWTVPGLNVGVIGARAGEPAVDQTGAYVGSDSGWFHKISPAGAIQWSYFDSSADRGLAGAAVLDSKHVFLATSSGNVVSLAKTTGRVEWMLRLTGEILAPPTLQEDSLFVTVTRGTQSEVLRLGRADGKVRWVSAPLAGRSQASPSIDPSLGLLFVGATDRRVYAITLDSGRHAWSRELDDEVQTTSSLAGRTVHVVTRGGFVYALAAPNGEVTWKTFVEGESRTPPTFEPSQGLILAGTDKGMLYALDRRTGRPHWADRTGTIFSGTAGALAVNGPGREDWVIWVTCADLVVCALSPKTGRIVTQLALRAPSLASPVAFENALYLTETPGGLTKYE